MTTKVIVTTTINPVTPALKKFASKKDWDLVVVADKKTPPESYKNIKCWYLSPEIQEAIYPALSKALGWNTIQRRNIGFLYAYNSLGADIIASVDDDNIPYDDWGENLLLDKKVEINQYRHKQNNVFDPLSVTNIKRLWHRGYPIELVPNKNDIVFTGKLSVMPLVQADLWDGDPDVDAMARMLDRPNVKIEIPDGIPFGAMETVPFNSQNTFLDRNVIPNYMMLPFVGRLDDIWGAYLLQASTGINCNGIVFNKPSVFQHRNDHNLVNDLEKEILGYRHGNYIATASEGQIIDRLNLINPAIIECWNLYRKAFKV